MMKSYILRFLTISLALLFLFNCSSPTSSKKRTPTVITISDVWITDAIDIDGDNFNSYLRLNFDLDVNKLDSVEVFVRLGIRVTDPMDTASYGLIFESVDFRIAGESSADGKYIGIELPPLQNNQPYMGVFDFLLEVYYSSNPDTRVVYASESEDADMGSIPMERPEIDIIIYSDWLIYNDGLFENGYYWSNAGYFAVQFDQPSGATSCMINAIRYHIRSNSANVFIRVWDNSGGYPGNYIYYTTTGDEYYLYSSQWNTAYLDIDVSNYDPFYVGYFQYVSGMPSLSADETTPLFGRSFYKVFLTGSIWANDTGGDYAIEVNVEYTTTSANGKPIVKSEWLSAELQ